MLVGRRTYDLSLTFPEWPYAGKPCVVFTRQALTSPRADVTFVAARPAEVIADLERQGRQRLWLVGGGELAAAFQADDLITRYIISVIPVVLGSGVPLFAPGPEALRPLRLVWQRAYPNGLVQLRYLRQPS